MHRLIYGFGFVMFLESGLLLTMMSCYLLQRFDGVVVRFTIESPILFLLGCGLLTLSILFLMVYLRMISGKLKTIRNGRNELRWNL